MQLSESIYDTILILTGLEEMSRFKNVEIKDKFFFPNTIPKNN